MSAPGGRARGPARVAVLGTGLTGAPIAVRLAGEGLPVTAWNRTRRKAEALAPHGVQSAATPAGAVATADVVLLALLDEEAVEAVAERALPALRPGTLVVDLATTSVEATKRLVASVAAGRGRPAKAPFFGSVPEAEQGALFFTLGCAAADRADAEAVLGRLGQVFHVGTPAEAAALKLALNPLVFSMVATLAETLALARAQGLDPELVLSVLERGTGVRAPIYLSRGRLMLDGDFAPRASVEMALKDLELIAASAGAAGLRLPLAAAAHEVFRAAARAGYADEDLAAVAKVVAA